MECVWHEQMEVNLKFHSVWSTGNGLCNMCICCVDRYWKKKHINLLFQTNFQCCQTIFIVMNIIIYFKLIIYFFSPKFGIFQFQNQMNRQYLFGSLEKNANAIPWNHLFHVSSLSTTSNVTADVWECMVHTRDTPKLSFFLVVYIESIIRNSHCKKFNRFYWFCDAFEQNWGLKIKFISEKKYLKFIFTHFIWIFTFGWSSSKFIGQPLGMLRLCYEIMENTHYCHISFFNLQF